MDYKYKYFEYKMKYFELKNKIKQNGGGDFPQYQVENSYPIYNEAFNNLPIQNERLALRNLPIQNEIQSFPHVYPSAERELEYVRSGKPPIALASEYQYFDNKEFQESPRTHKFNKGDIVEHVILKKTGVINRFRKSIGKFNYYIVNYDDGSFQSLEDENNLIRVSSYNPSEPSGPSGPYGPNNYNPSGPSGPNNYNPSGPSGPNNYNPYVQQYSYNTPLYNEPSRNYDLKQLIKSKRKSKKSSKKSKKISKKKSSKSKRKSKKSNRK